MHLEIFVEESSAKAALDNLLPKLLTTEHSFLIHPFQDKGDLLANLPGRLKGYGHWLPEDWRLLVLVDEDRHQPDCLDLKDQLEVAARSAGLITKTSAPQGRFHVVNRIVIVELEAWFFGDVPALVAAYPGVPESLAQKAPYRNPDAVTGGTWEALRRVLRRAGYYPDFFPKVEVARTISAKMAPDRNRSHSFQVFREGLGACIR